MLCESFVLFVIYLLLAMNISYRIRRREELATPIRDYDLAIERLKCYASNEFSSLCLSRNRDGAEMHFPESPFFASKFCQLKNHEYILALAGEDGIVALHNTMKRNRSDKEAVVSGFVAHNNAIFDLTWMEGNMHLVTGSGDHQAKLWDIDNGSELIRAFNCHNRSIKTVASRPEDPYMFASGGRDGMVLLWDTRSVQEAVCIKPENAIFTPHQTPSKSEVSGKARKHARHMTPSRGSSITGLVFQDVHTLLSCSAGDGKIKVWDLRKNYWCYRGLPLPLHSLSHPKRAGRIAFSSLVLDPGRVRLYASSLDDTIYCYNVATYETMPIATYTGHHNSSFYVKSCLSPDGHYLVSGSSNGKACIWNVKSPSQPLVHLVGHEEEVMNVAWCPVGDIQVVTCCEDGIFRLWNVGLDDESENDEMLLGWAEVVDQKDALQKRRQTLQNSSTQVTTVGKVSEENPAPSDVHETVAFLSTTCDSDDKQLKRKVLDSISLQVCEDSNMSNAESCDNVSSSFTPTKTINTFSNLSSPTSNLPNLVVDGTSPHHHCSPVFRLKENVDWLTRLKKEKVPYVPSCPKTHGAPKRKARRSQSTPDGRKSPRGALLKYFKVAEKPSTD